MKEMLKNVNKNPEPSPISAPFEAPSLLASGFLCTPPHTPPPKSRWPAGASASSQGINSRQSRQGAHPDRSCGSPNCPDRGLHR